MELPDVQQLKSGFYVTAVDKVGVRNLKVPFSLKTPGGPGFNTIANISSYCDLGENVKGINMSRISRTINDIMSKPTDGFTNLAEFAQQLKIEHGASNIWAKAEFDYIIKSKSPITNLTSYEPVSVVFESNIIDGNLKNYITVESIEMSLCPCSKEMSLLINNVSDEEREEIETAGFSYNLMSKINNAGFGAHNQKSRIKITIDVSSFKHLWIEDIVDICKKSSSCSSFATLKREDEKYVTEASYMGKYVNSDYKLVKTSDNDGPKFVEDIARDCAKQLDELLDNSINDYVIVVNNEESIHSQDIYATAIKTAGRNLK